jgi:hypothetical protein
MPTTVENVLRMRMEYEQTDLGMRFKKTKWLEEHWTVILA